MMPLSDNNGGVHLHSIDILTISTYTQGDTVFVFTRQHVICMYCENQKGVKQIVKKLEKQSLREKTEKIYDQKRDWRKARKFSYKKP